MKFESPQARFEDIVIQELEHEILIYDTKSNRTICLNETIAEIWKLADGTRNVKQISNLMSRKFRSEISEELVLFGLNELSKENLLEKQSSGSDFSKEFSRRELIRRIGMASVIALPIITVITAPQSANAASAVCPTGTACRCRYGTLPTQTTCVNTDPLECNSGCSCNFGPTPGAACSEVTPGNFVCLGVCQN